MQRFKWIYTDVCVFQARRALQASRGLVRLKSLLQEQSVKRQAATILRCMQTHARVQSQIRSRRIRMSEENQALQRQLLMKKEKELEKSKVYFFILLCLFNHMLSTSIFSSLKLVPPLLLCPW